MTGLAHGAADAEPIWQPTSTDLSATATSPRRLAWRRFRRNRMAIAALVVLIGLALIALFAPWIAPYDPLTPDFKAIGKPPSLAHPMGTDDSGRDVLSRLMYGARISLSIGFVAVSMAVSIEIIPLWYNFRMD